MKPCRFCKRPLTDPVSVRLGFGPVCGKKRVPGYIARMKSERDGQLTFGQVFDTQYETVRLEF